MATRSFPVDPQLAVRGLLAFQAGDAVAAATVPILRRDLERLGCPRWMRNTIPVLKASSAAGLLLGRRHPRLGRLTTDALLAYFLCALGAHARVRDEPWRYVGAAGMLGVVLLARQAYADDGEDVIDLTDEPVPAEPTESARDQTRQRRRSSPTTTSA